MKFFAGVLTLFAAVSCLALAAETETEKKTVDPEAMVAKVNNDVIKEKDVAAESQKWADAQARRMPPGMELPDWMQNKIRTNVVDMMIEKSLMEQKMAAKKLTVSDEDVAKEIEKVAKQQGVNVDDVPAELAKMGMTMDDFKAQIKMTVQRDKIIESEAGDLWTKEEDVKKFYDDNPQFFEQPEQVRAAHILILTQGKSDEEKTAAKAKIEEILAKAKAGEDFAELAKQHSEDPGSKDKGGEYTFPRGQMVPAFEDAAFGLEDGQISGVIETEYGYHIIKKYEYLKPSKEPLDSVKDKIKGYLDNQKRNEFWQTYSETMRKEASVEYSEAEQKRRELPDQPPMRQNMGTPPQPQPQPQPKPEAQAEPKAEDKPAAKPAAKPEKK